MKKQIVTIGIILTFLIIGFSGCTDNTKAEIKITNVDIKGSLINNNEDHVYNITATFKNTGSVDLVVDLVFYLKEGYANQTGESEGLQNSISDRIYLSPGNSTTKTKTLRGHEWSGIYYFLVEVQATCYSRQIIITEDKYRSQKYWF